MAFGTLIAGIGWVLLTGIFSAFFPALAVLLHGVTTGQPMVELYGFRFSTAVNAVSIVAGYLCWLTVLASIALAWVLVRLIPLRWRKKIFFCCRGVFRSKKSGDRRHTGRARRALEGAGAMVLNVDPGDQSTFRIGDEDEYLGDDEYGPILPRGDGGGALQGGGEVEIEIEAARPVGANIPLPPDDVERVTAVAEGSVPRE